jgi:hypothetical protein
MTQKLTKMVPDATISVNAPMKKYKKTFDGVL